MVQRALEYEERRQGAVLANGGIVLQETRLWNEEKGESATMRTKEAADDYRYFPDPDLPPLTIERSFIAEIENDMPELPALRRARFATHYRLPDYDTGVLMDDRRVADYFEATAIGCGNAKLASNWVMTEVLRVMNERDIAITVFPIGPDRLAQLIDAQSDGRISRNAAKRVFEHLANHDVEVDAAIAELGLEQISNRKELAALVQEVLAANPDPVADYRAGREKAMHALQGMVMKKTSGKANPQLTRELLIELLSTD
jgi:aspartyl-tRNA(Asn)/glutamyl-tRNA(Gln) amidotransferase subunit B